MKPLEPSQALALAAEALRGGPATVSLVVVEAGPAGPRPGARMLVWADRQLGTLGDPALDRAAVALARSRLGEGQPATAELGSGATACTVYLEAHRPPPSLVIVGAGHIAQPLSRLGAMLGYRVTVLDDRPDFATRERFPEAAAVLRADFTDPLREVEIRPDTHLVLVTRGHKYDFEALRGLLARPVRPAYIGMVGSRRRVRAALVQLAGEGIPPERLEAIHAPIGLDIGAETPGEIAVAIAAELVMVRRGGSGAPLRETERVLARWVRGGAPRDDHSPGEEHSPR